MPEKTVVPCSIVASSSFSVTNPVPPEVAVTASRSLTHDSVMLNATLCAIIKHTARLSHGGKRVQDFVARVLHGVVLHDGSRLVSTI